MEEVILETRRLYLRKMRESDYSALALIHQDPITMQAYEGAFSKEETEAWIKKNLDRYKTDGLGLWAVVLKSSQNLIGECGLTWQNGMNGEKVLEVGYLFNRDYWHQGYAIEAACACRDLAFEKLHAKNVYSIIRSSNEASKKVARRNGMTKIGMLVKHYRGIDMPHDVFMISKKNWLKRKTV